MKQIWLRATYFGHGSGPMTWVSSKDDLNQDIHVIAEDTRRKFGRQADVEIFEWENDLISASKEAERRARKRLPEKEHYKNTLHDFLIATFFKAPVTTIIAPASPAPLSTTEIKAIFERVKQHPEYKNRSIKVTSEDGGTVWLTAGDIDVR